MNDHLDDASSPATDPALAPTPTPPERPRRWLWMPALLLLAALAAAGWFQLQQLREAQRGEAEWREVVDALRAEVAALDRELDAGRERQRQIEARMGDNASGIRVVRESLLGMAERATRVEEAVAALAEVRQDAALSLRLDDLELLLQQAELRAGLLADRAAAARAYQHAEALLSRIEDPAYAALRVALQQEREGLAALGPDPRPALRQQISGLLDILPGLAFQDGAEALPEEAPLALRLLDRLVKVRRVSDSQMALSPLERASRRASLELTLGLALAALEGADELSWKHHLKRAREDLPRLFDAQAAAVVAAVQILDRAIQQPLRVEPPALGSTLRELRAMRATRSAGQRGEVAAPEDGDPPALERP